MKPMWIDLQVNGYAGVDFNAPGLSVEAVRAVVERLNADGTAAFLPTLVTGDPETVVTTIRTVVTARKRYAECESAIPGFFLEGPFISPEPGAVGTHPIEWVRPPDQSLFGRFQDAAEGLVKIVNVAAEIPGMPDFVRALSAQGEPREDRNVLVPLDGRAALRAVGRRRDDGLAARDAPDHDVQERGDARPKPEGEERKDAG